MAAALLGRGEGGTAVGAHPAGAAFTPRGWVPFEPPEPVARAEPCHCRRLRTRPGQKLLAAGQRVPTALWSTCPPGMAPTLGFTHPHLEPAEPGGYGVRG